MSWILLVVCNTMCCMFVMHHVFGWSYHMENHIMIVKKNIYLKKLHASKSVKNVPKDNKDICQVSNRQDIHLVFIKNKGHSVKFNLNK